MKKSALTLFVCLALFACKQVEKQERDLANEEKSEVVASESEAIHKLTSELMIPLEIVEEGSVVATERYGLDFSGNCYACDVANLLIDGEMITLMNACDLENQVSFKVTGIEEKGNVIIVKTPVNEFVFEQIDEVPVYKVTVTGQSMDKEFFRMGAFYTTESKLKTFSIYDCGEFDG